jgi:predicted transcriptional regulator
MANDIHVYLTESEVQQLKRLAEREARSITNMARKLMRDALAALDRQCEERSK